jgi:hypothetical protein
VTTWVNPTFSGPPPTAIEGDKTWAQISTAKHSWKYVTIDFKTYNTVQSDLKKQIIMVVEPIYIGILNDDLVDFANSTSRYMLDHLFLYYSSITAVHIEKNFKNMRKALEPQQSVETLFK